MLTILTVLHILFALALVLFVLLHDPKGGAAGVFGGGSAQSSLFGASGATSFLNTMTKYTAILFAISCIAITFMTSRPSDSVLDDYVPQAPMNSALPGAPDSTGEPTDASESANPAETAPAKSSEGGE